MSRTQIIPNELQGGQGRPAWVDGTPPVTLTRLGAAKVEFLARGVAQLKANWRVLELFGGTGLSTAVIAAQLSKPERLVSIDLHYGAGDWRYCVEANYRDAASEQRLKQVELPKFICADAAQLPLADATFDAVLAPDSPRTRFDASGIEAGLNDVEQRTLFERATRESLRVLKPGGVWAATAPRSWLGNFPEVKIIEPSSSRLKFKPADDPVVYARLVK